MLKKRVSKTSFLFLLLLCFLAPANVLAAPASTDCDEAAEVGAQTYDATDKEFYYCRDHTDGWEALGAIAPAAGGGSSGPTYEGTTSTAYNGFQGKLPGIDALCNAQYTGSRVLRTSDLKYLTLAITNSTEAWIYRDQSNSSIFTPSPTINCENFYSSSTGDFGTTYQGNNGTFREENCGFSRPFHCVSD